MRGFCDATVYHENWCIVELTLSLTHPHHACCESCSAKLKGMAKVYAASEVDNYLDKYSFEGGNYNIEDPLHSNPI